MILVPSSYRLKKEKERKKKNFPQEDQYSHCDPVYQ